LSEFSQNGKGANVFACSDRPTIISRAKDRLVYSSVNVEVSPSEIILHCVIDVR